MPNATTANTVGELIEQLQEYDPALRVVQGYDWKPPTVELYQTDNDGDYLQLGTQHQAELDAGVSDRVQGAPEKPAPEGRAQKLAQPEPDPEHQPHDLAEAAERTQEEERPHTDHAQEVCWCSAGPKAEVPTDGPGQTE